MSSLPGYPIVLTADRVLMADYQTLFDGMLAASLTTSFPPALMEGLMMPRPHSRDGRAVVAPLGLRRIEAALLDGGFTREEVAIVDEGALEMAIGPETRVVGICTGEPTGQGMSTTTMVGIAGGKVYPEAMFRRLLSRVQDRLAAVAPEAQLVLGGPGAWQVAGDAPARRMLGMQHLVTGYAEGNVAGIFHMLMRGDSLPEIITGEGVPATAIPPIRGASTMGVVELSRGCGLGCSFCTLANLPMQHLPEETIEADIRTNLAAGRRNVAILSEDFFRYGGNGASVAPGRLLALLERLRRIDTLRLLQIDHANVRSIELFSDDELRAAHRLLVGQNRHECLWVNVGVETASGTLLRANGGQAKIGPYPPDTWAERCATQARRLMAAGFLPMVSLILGLPGETPEDVQRTLDWVRTFRDARITIFPVLLAPLADEPTLRVRDLTPLHWDLIETCYALNFRWVPRLYADNQRGAGVPSWRRYLLQTLGLGQTLLWKTLFTWHRRGK